MTVSDANALLRDNGVFWNEPAKGPLGVNILAFRFKMHLKNFANVIWGYYFH